jgi:autophagy-related protein 2
VLLGEDGGRQPEGGVSKLSEQPKDMREGVEMAYRSLGHNLGKAARTIFAVPMTVYEKPSPQVSLSTTAKIDLLILSFFHDRS